MNSVGATPEASIGQVSSGPWSETATHNSDENVTHVRGRVDDVVRHLGMIRGRITPENFDQVSGLLDDADKAVESALDSLLADDV